MSAGELMFTVPLTPPSGNHYKQPRGAGGYFLTEEAQAFYSAVAIMARGRSLEAELYEVTMWVYLPPKARGDGDNFFKCGLDALERARVIHSDAAIVDYHLYKRRALSRAEERTEYTIRPASMLGPRVAERPKPTL